MSAQSCITGPVGIPITATGKQDRRDVHDNRIESRRRCARRGGLRRAVAQSPPRRRQSADSAPINVTWAKWRCTWSPSSSFGAWKCSATWMKTASVRWCESSGQTEPAPLCRWPSGARRWSRRRTGRPQRSPGSGAVALGRADQRVPLERRAVAPSTPLGKIMKPLPSRGHTSPRPRYVSFAQLDQRFLPLLADAPGCA